MSNDEQPETLKVFAKEEIKTKEVPPGTAKPSAKDKEEALPPEEVEKRRKVMLEYTRLQGRYADPHSKRSRWVEAKDIERVMADGKDLVAMCNLPRGKYGGISALSHPQIDDKDPLRFFVLPDGKVIINPVITEHTKAPVFKNEACMSHPYEDIKTMVPRYNKITVTYQTLSKLDKDSDVILSNPVTESLTGGPAHIFQHKVGHLNGATSIYDDKNYDPLKSIGVGDGDVIDPHFWETQNNKINKK